MKYLVALALLSFFLSTPAAAVTPASPSIHLFGSVSCDLCHEAASYLASVAKRNGTSFYYHDLNGTPESYRLMRNVASELGVKATGTPFIVVGRRAHVGWNRDITGPMVEDDLALARLAGDEDVVALQMSLLATSPDAAPAQGANRRLLLALLVGGTAVGGVGFFLLRKK